ncbi:MAG: PKD domain-containing protein, partial [Syntrophobacteraceae bacterium]
MKALKRISLLGGIVILGLSCFLLASRAEVADLEISKYRLISKYQVGLLCLYTYRADVTNSGSKPVLAVKAKLNGCPRDTVILDGALSFGDIPAGSTVTSKDSFTLLKIGHNPFDPNVLSWTISGKRPADSPPVASAGPDQTVFVTQTVQLDGSKSSDPDGDALTFKWSFVSIPAGSGAALSDPSSVNPTFVVDRPGTYIVQLVANDGLLDSAPARVTISTQNSKPVANGGPDQTVHIGDTVTLDGSKSSDVDGDLLTFKWSLTTLPAGSTAVLSNPSDVKPSFEVDKPGTYVAQLIVNDGKLDSAPATVTIITENSKPVANAGPGQTVHAGDTVTLDGSKSSDVDGDLLTFKWSLTTLPSGSAAVLSNPSAVKPSFQVDMPGTYVAQLIVNDGKLDSTPATVSIITENSRPVADAGPDQTVFVGDTVTLDGSKSSDVDGDLLTFKWSFTSLPAGSGAVLSSPSDVKPSFQVDKPGTYVAQLIVNDGNLDSAPATVTVTTQNSKPVANAGPDQSVFVGATVTLDGGKSSDADGDPLTFKWSFTSIPAASTAVISNPFDVRPAFHVDKPGTYVAQLIVNDGSLDSAPSTVTVTTQNSKPVANAGPDQTVFVGDTVTLDGSGSTDADNDPLTCSWSFTSLPSGSGAKLSDATALKPVFSPDLEGTYVAQLIVNDGKVNSDPATVTITAQFRMVSVPNVSGMTQAAAEAAITGIRLIVGTETSAHSSTVPAGNVISQSPAAGSSAPEGTAVGLVLSIGPLLPPNLALITVGQVTNGQATVNGLAGSAEAGTQVTVTNLRTGESVTVTVNSDGSFSVSIAARTGDGLSITLTDSAGNTSSAASVSVTPPDPSTTASAIDPTVATTIGSATSFLYTGSNSIQTGVAAGTIQPQRAAVIRGQVLAADGSALPAVAISILNHPEFGQTFSRADGMFDMAVNGGGPLTVDYQKSGYLPAQRQVNAPWQDYAFSPNVVMIKLDSKVSTIDLTAATPIQVARGSTVTDTDGTRTATLLFSQGTTAAMVLPDGTTRPLTTLNVRATEYTVGPMGPDRMPAQLPPTSGYTYCVELSADEAIAAGAQTVTFSKPVIDYIENFSGFPTGMNMPVGYYDRTKGQWMASDDGLVIKVLSITNGMADLDIDGSNQAAGSAALASLGITDQERTQLAALYTAGQSLWRMAIGHFTSFDFNYPYGLPPDTAGPNQTINRASVDSSCKQSGSIIGCESQTLGEDVSVTGTGLKLHYQNDRQVGHNIDNTIEIPLTGAAIPANLKRVTLIVSVAGRQIQSSFPPSPNQTTVFTWDGLDAYGRTLQGAQTVTIQIGYVYQAVYCKSNGNAARSFGSVSGIPITSTTGAHIYARTELTLWENLFETVRPWNAKGQKLGGWTLHVHHFYDALGQKLYLGDGSQRSAAGIPGSITTKAGNGGIFGYSGDGGPAVQTALNYPNGIAVAPDGGIYIADSGNNRIRRVGPDGIITTVAGNGSYGYSGDGGPATQAQIYVPVGVAVAPDGSIYIADSGNNRIRRVGSEGIITTVAGNGTRGYGGDGGPATQAQITSCGVAVAPDGSIYIADSNNNRIRRVGPDGIITTLAGNGTRGYGGDGGPGNQAALNYPSAVAVAPDGSIYIADESNYRIRRVGSDGIITTVAGNGTYGCTGDGGTSAQAEMSFAPGVAVASDGSIYIADESNYRIRRVGPDGIITTVAGNGTFGYSGDGGPSTQARLSYPSKIAVAPDGSIYVVDYNRVRAISGSLPGFSAGDILVPAEDGSQVYHFDGTGRHLDTIQPLTGATIYHFSYDGSGRLSSVTDGNGNTTTIYHDGSGNPIAIITPFGQQTTFTVDSKGYLASITNPAGEAYQFSYTADGLMVSMTNPNNNTYSFTYDGYGRLTKDSDPAGGSKTLTRTDSVTGYSVALTTAMNRTTTYQVDNLSTGGRKRTVVSPDGNRKETIEGTDGSRNTTLADGTLDSLLQGPDPRFGILLALPETRSNTTPGGLSRATAMSRTVTLSDPLNPFSLTSQTDTVSINGRTYQRTFDGSARTFSMISPEGRQGTSTIDALGKIVSSQVSGLAPTGYAYDSRGRLSAVTAGTGTDTRTTTLGYNANGFLSTLTDPLGRSLGFQYDSAGRITSKTDPDGALTSFQYDRNGNLTSITPPDRPTHVFTYTSVDQDSSYLTPLSGNYTYTYDTDRELTNIVFPSGKEIVNTYADARLTSIATPEGEIDLSYLAGPRVGSIVKGQERIDYGYDGSLLTSETLSGTINQAIGYTYDNDLRVSRLTYAGRSIDYAYDDDGLLTKAGDFTITRNAANGLPQAVTVYLPTNWSAIPPGNNNRMAIAGAPGYGPLLALSQRTDENGMHGPVITDAPSPKFLLASNTSPRPAFAILQLTGLTIQGADSVRSGTNSNYTATALYNNGSSKTVSASFSLSPTSAATISSGGLLSAAAVTSNQTVTMNASYTENGVTQTASMNVGIIAPGTTFYLTGLTIQGSDSVNAGAASTYTATATYNDGSSAAVSAVFSLSPTTAATISSEGVLSANAVDSFQTV